MAIFCTCGSNNWENVGDRWVHAARQFVSIEFSFHPYNILAWLPQGRPEGKQKCGKIAIFGLTHWFKHRITRKLLKIDRYMLRGVWQALSYLSIHATYCVIVAGVRQGKQKCGLRYVKMAIFCTCGSNNWETVEDRWVNAAREFVSIEFCFHPYNI